MQLHSEVILTVRQPTLRDSTMAILEILPEGFHHQILNILKPFYSTKEGFLFFFVSKFLDPILLLAAWQIESILYHLLFSLFFNSSLSYLFVYVGHFFQRLMDKQ